MLICASCFQDHSDSTATITKNIGYVNVCAKCNARPKSLIHVPDEKPAPKWPQFIKVYIHGSRDNMLDHGQKIGLTGEALSLFSYACSEVCLKLEVQEDGRATIIGME